MEELAPGHNLQPVSRMLAGALAHLAQHMKTGCPRAAHFGAKGDTTADLRSSLAGKNLP